MLGEIESGAFAFSTSLEDIHMNVESRLREIVGDPAARLHTARSRNDQVAVDIRLWVRDAHDRTDEQLTALIKALLARPNLTRPPSCRASPICRAPSR